MIFLNIESPENLSPLGIMLNFEENLNFSWEEVFTLV